MRIGPYELEDAIGRGGVGVVHRARSAEHGVVAIKLLGRVDPERLARFDRERRLIGSFTAHDGFVPLLDAGTSPQGPYLVMPLLEGGTLSERIEKGALAVEDTLALGRRLAAALARAHERGVVHRDLKPANILFTKRGADAASWGEPLVADLGLAKHFRGDAPGASQSASLSRSGAFRGTPGYAAPEQMYDAREVGPPADVFALGALLYACLAGEPPFRSDTFVGLVNAVTMGRYEPLRARRAEVPRWLASVIDKALATETKDRYPDAHALGRALEAPSRLPGGRSARIAAGLLVLLAVVVGVAAGASARRPDPRAPEPPPAPAPPTVVPPTAAALLASGDRKERRGDLEGALLDFEKAVALEPRNARALSARGKVRFKRSDARGARADVDAAVEADPKCGDAWARRGWVRGRSGDDGGALADLDRALSLDPTIVLALSARGGLRLASGDEAGLSDIDRAVELSKDDPTPLLERGTARSRRGDLDGALLDHDRAIALDPGDPDIWVARGRIHAKRHEDALALSDFDRGIALGTKDPDAFISRGAHRLKLGQVDDAIQDFDRAAAGGRRSAVLFQNRATAKLRRGDHAAAVDDYTRAIDLDPRGVEALIGRGSARAYLGRRREALADLDAALEIEPGSWGAWATRSQIKEALGDRKGAIADLEHIPPAQRNPSMEAWLERLRGGK